MRIGNKYGMAVAAVALLASSTAVCAADADIQALQNQINALSQQINALKAQPAAVPAISRSTYDIGIPDPSRGAFVIPGTNTTLHVGGFIDLSTTFDTASSVGPAGYNQLAGFNSRSYVNNAAGGTTDNGNIALPGTPYAKSTGRFQSDARFSRLAIETDTPSEYGVIGSMLEMDLDGDGLTANQKTSNSVAPRLRRAFLTFGNLTIGQTQTLTYDAPTNVGSIDNNAFMGQESGNRYQTIQYRWNIDPEQKHQLYVGIEQGYSDVAGIAPNNFQAGGQMAYQTDAVTHIPDVTVKFVENGTWGRFYAAGVLRNIEVNTDGTPGSTAFSGTSASLLGQAVHTNIWSGGIDGGVKVFTPFFDPRSNVVFNAEWGPAGGRLANYSAAASAVIGPDGKLHTQQEAGFDVGYNAWFTDNWKANLIYGLQHSWNKTGMQTTSGLWKQGQQAEANVFWMPTSYVDFGLAYTWIQEQAVQGQCLNATATFLANGTTFCTGAALAGTKGGISGATAYDNRFEFRTRGNF